MKRTLQTLLCLLAALQLCGGHLGLMQVVAWAQMVRDYSAEKGIIEGVKDTFDGEHPCAMCSKISQEKKDEQKQPSLPLEKLTQASKWLVLLPDVVVPTPGWQDAAVVPHTFEHDVLVGQWRQSPPVPPPRAIG